MIDNEEAKRRLDLGIALLVELKAGLGTGTQDEESFEEYVSERLTKAMRDGKGLLVDQSGSGRCLCGARPY